MKWPILAVVFTLFAASNLYADPGENTVLNVCIQEPAFQLIDALQGTPDSGGQWFDPDGNDVLSGIFEPGISAAGDYTYLVGTESATLAITAVNCNTTPANDNCFNAQFINPATNIPFTTFGATTDGLAHAGEENCAENGQAQTENDVWFFYLASCDGVATVSTIGQTTLDTKIIVYSYNCPGTTEDILACSDNAEGTYQSLVAWPTVTDQLYLIRLGESPGPGSGNGTFSLSEVCDGQEPPENQFCADAAVISPGSAIPFSTFNAVTDGPSHAGDTTCDLYGSSVFANDVWYTYQASCDGTATFSSIGGTFADTRVAIYSNGCPENLDNLIACNDDYQGYAQSQVTWSIQQGITYTIRLGNSELSNGADGTFSLVEYCGDEPPANDNCSAAQIIFPSASIPFVTMNANTDGPSHLGSPVCDFFGGAQIVNDVWYKYIAACDGVAEVSTVGGTSLDTRLAVYAQYCPNDLDNLIVCNDDDGSLQSTVAWNVAEGDSYYIRLGEFTGGTGGSGTFSLTETCMEICTMPVIGYQTVCNGLDDFESFYISANVITLGNVGSFSLTPSEQAPLQTIIEPGLYQFGPFTNDSTVFFTVTSLSDETCTETSYELSADCYPDNLNFSCDDLEQAFPNQYTSYTNVDSYTSGDVISDPGCGFGQIHNDLWYTYSAICTGEATWSNCAFSETPTRMAVYENSCGSEDFQLIACSDTDACSENAASLTFETFQGSAYILRLGGTSDASFGNGVFIVEEDVNLVSAGADTAITICSPFSGSIVLSQYLTGASSGGEWTDDDDSGALLGNVVFFSSLTPGEYRFSYTVSGACNDATSTITVLYDLCDGISAIENEPLFKLYPNPATQFVRIESSMSAVSDLQIDVYDVSGRVVWRPQMQQSNSKSFGLVIPAEIERGVYFLRIANKGSDRVETHKLVIER